MLPLHFWESGLSVQAAGPSRASVAAAQSDQRRRRRRVKGVCARRMRHAIGQSGVDACSDTDAGELGGSVGPNPMAR